MSKNSAHLSFPLVIFIAQRHPKDTESLERKWGGSVNAARRRLWQPVLGFTFNCGPLERLGILLPSYMARQHVAQACSFEANWSRPCHDTFKQNTARGGWKRHVIRKWILSQHCSQGSQNQLKVKLTWTFTLSFPELPGGLSQQLGIYSRSAVVMALQWRLRSRMRPRWAKVKGGSQNRKSEPKKQSRQNNFL